LSDEESAPIKKENASDDNNIDNDNSDEDVVAVEDRGTCKNKDDDDDNEDVVIEMIRRFDENGFIETLNQVHAEVRLLNDTINQLTEDNKAAMADQQLEHNNIVAGNEVEHK
jgi:hypothetical protein